MLSRYLANRVLFHYCLPGYLLHVTKDRQLELPSQLTLLIWELVAAAALALIYGPYDMHTAAGYKLYIICRKWVWGLCLAWVTIACVKECILLSNISSHIYYLWKAKCLFNELFQAL